MAAGKGLARLVRLCCVLAALGYGGYYAYDEMFKPGEVRRRVQEEFEAKFEGVDVEVGSARLRPFLGGVNVSDLKLIRRDDPTRTPFLIVPHAVIWHNKADLVNGLTPSKIEFEEAQLRLVRSAAGKWNVEGITKPGSEVRQLPILVLKKAHVELVDEKYGQSALVELSDLDVTLINDPVETFTFEARGSATALGPFLAKGRFETGVGASGSLDLNGIELGSELYRLVGMVAPEAVEHLKTLSGSATCRTRWAWRKDRLPPIAYDSVFELREGRCTSSLLPATVDQLSLKARIRDGDLTLENLTARLGDSGLSVKAEIDAAKPDPKSPLVLLSPVDIEDRMRRVEVTVSDLVVGPELFERLPPNLSEAREMFAPAGPADVTFEQHREGGTVRKKFILRPKGMSAKYRGFPHPVDRIRGTIEASLDDGQPHRYEIDLVGEGNGKPITLKGRYVGGENRDVDLILTGSDIVLDKTIIDALPDELPAFVRRLRPTAKGDFTVKIRHNARIRRDHGPLEFDNEFDIKIRSGSIMYEDFPYPLRNLAGTLYIRTVPDKPSFRPTEMGQPPRSDVGIVEFREFTATGSNGCKLKIKGGKHAEPGGTLLVFDVKGDAVPLDGELGRAIAKLKIENSWATFAPSGRMNCAMIVRIHERDGPPGKPSLPFNPNKDLELGISFNGPSIRPTFFAYQMTDAVGQVSFAQGRVDLRQFQAQHGKTKITLPAAEILLPPTGGFWADLYDLKVTPVILDKEFMTALPRGLRSACEGLEFKGGMALHAKRLVIDDQPKGQPPPQPVPQVASAVRTAVHASPQRESLPTVYWDGVVAFRDASLSTGVSWEGVAGKFESRGLYLGDKLGRVVGNLTFDKGKVLKQPVESLTARFEVDPAKPDVIDIPWINSKMYGGEVGGQARLELTTPVRFDLSLNGAKLKLEEFARVNKLGPKTEIHGVTTAQLSLSNPIDPATHKPILQGSGSIDVPNGRILDLPIMLDVIKLARFQPMDHTAFEEAHAVFRIRGDRVKIGQLDLLGKAISLGGEGEMNLDGSKAQFEFYTVWSNIRNILGGGGELTSRISGNLYRIRVAGDLGGNEPPRVTQEALPGIVDPIRRLIGRQKK